MSTEWDNYCNSLEEKLKIDISNFQAGGLKHHVDSWQSMTSDPWILNAVQGCDIELDRIPYQSSVPPPLNFTEAECNYMDREVETLLKKGVVKESRKENGDYFSNVFLRPKKDGSYRIILNLKHFNTWVTYRHFKMDSLKSAISLMTPNCYMASIDLKDAYYSVPVKEEFQKFLKFQWKGHIFKFVCLPMGLTSSPRIFTKITKPVYATLRQKGHINSGYIDDIYLQGSDVKDRENNIRDTVHILQDSGFTIQPTKSVFRPTQILSHLGFVLNSRQMTVTVTSEKAQKIAQLCQHMMEVGVVTLRELAELIGQLVASFPGVMYGPLFYRRFGQSQNTSTEIGPGEF